MLLQQQVEGVPPETSAAEMVHSQRGDVASANETLTESHQKHEVQFLRLQGSQVFLFFWAAFQQRSVRLDSKGEVVLGGWVDEADCSSNPKALQNVHEIIRQIWKFPEFLCE